jgi:hypothetical protein
MVFCLCLHGFWTEKNCLIHRGIFFIYIFFGVPHLATFIFFVNEYVIATSIAYIHLVYGGIQTHDLLDVSLLP